VIPAVSFVVIGLDEEAHLARALSSAHAALAEAGVVGEVLYVDSGSRDDSRRIAARLGATVLTIAREGASAARARNAGLERARARWVHFLDGDMEVEPGWLAQALAEAEERGLDGLGGSIAERLEGASIWSRMFGHDWNARGARVGPIGGAGLWRRTSLAAVGGFDVSLEVGEDPDLCRRMEARGFRVERNERPMATHVLGLTGPLAWWRRAVSVGRSAASIALRHGDRRLVLQRFVAPLLLAVLLLMPATRPLAALLLGAALVRRAWLDRRAGLSRTDAALHAVHVYAVKVPQLVGGASSLARRFGGNR
jgi:glycosyltransferase involved in cell wall biosynthesis